MDVSRSWAEIDSRTLNQELTRPYHPQSVQ